MCGIVGYAGKSDAKRFLVDGLKRLEYRGYDSAGIALLERNGQMSFKKTAGRIENLKREIKENDINGNIGIGHTRWATHGKVSERNSHPHFSNNGKFAVVHNGIIENYEEIKEELISEGFEFYSETDTEVIPNLLQKYYKGDIKSAVNNLKKRIKGSYALGIICSDLPGTLIAVKNFSPLILGIAENANIIASDVTAIAEETKKIIYIEDDDTVFITPNSLEIYAGTLMTRRKISTIDWNVTDVGKSGYNHYMMKEICEQPTVIRRILENYVENLKLNFRNVKINQDFIKKIDRIVIVGCGSAYHAGMVGKYVFEEITGLVCETELASEFRYRNPFLTEKTLVIAISQSGETADTIAAIKEAKLKNARVLSIVNTEGSAIARLSDYVIHTLAGPEIAVATTKGYTSQLLCLYLLAIYFGEIKNTIDYETKENLLLELAKIPTKTEEIINGKEKIARMAEKYKNEKNVFFIGRNIDYAASLEASLKLKEISYIHSEAFAAGELKHGTISLIFEGTPVIAISSVDFLRDKLMSNVKEVEARGARVLIATTENVREGFDKIMIPKINPLFSASISVIPFQIFSYYMALYNGCDIDKPRNLAKSVTVE